MRTSPIILLVSCLFMTGCELSLPTDEEMTRYFTQHEAAFNEIRNIVTQRTRGSYYPPYRTDTIYGDDSSSIEGMPEEHRLLLDSLLNEIGCERVFYPEKKLPTGTDKDTRGITIRIPYFVYGLSIGGTSKEFLYEPDRERIPATERYSDLNDIYRRTGGSDTTLYKPIKDGWYIMLDHDN